jgi:hypothetical protein
VMCGYWVQYARLGSCVSLYILEDTGETFTDRMTGRCASWVAWEVTALQLVHEESMLVLQ